jgi:catalase (peroxidase I)
LHNFWVYVCSSHSCTFSSYWYHFQNNKTTKKKKLSKKNSDGGGQRFEPERSWSDNTNLDKAHQLLLSIKLKYGNGLSWGDLFALAGTVALETMGYPEDTIGFCAGRLDMMDNSQTIALGPSVEQEQYAHCAINGQCPYPLGSNTLGGVRSYFVWIVQDHLFCLTLRFCSLNFL